MELSRFGPDDAAVSIAAALQVGVVHVLDRPVALDRTGNTLGLNTVQTCISYGDPGNYRGDDQGSW